MSAPTLAAVLAYNPLVRAPQRAIGLVIVIVAVVAWLFFIFSENRRTPAENAEAFLNAPNRKQPPEDDVYEGPRLDRFLSWALVTMSVIAIGLPLYWMAEPGRQEGSIRGFDRRSLKRAEAMFASSKAEHPGFGCVDCHGPGGTGGEAPWNLPQFDENGLPVKDANGKDLLKPVSWSAPALNTVALRYRTEQIRSVLIYGRGATKPMPAWGVEGGGAMNAQQIDDLVNYIKYLAIKDNKAALDRYNEAWERNGNDASKAYAEAVVVAAADQQAKSAKAVADYLANKETGQVDGKPKTEGQALFELNCARCHTKGWSYKEPQEAGGGWFGPNLTGGSVTRQFPSAEAQAAYIKDGVEAGKAYGVGGVQHFQSGGMPYFANTLTDEQIKAIVEYERSL